MMWTKTRAAASMLALCLALSACDSPEEREAKYIKRGMQLFEQGSYDKARVEFKNAAKISPTDPDVRYRLGLVDEAQGNLRDAFINFVRAEELC
jgi:cellulose synthase operon protein C